jgi:hypothetical protein
LDSNGDLASRAQSHRAALDLAEGGSIDADLGGNVIKQRVGRSGGGKSGGYRTVILYKKGDRAFFVYGFPKSARDNIEEDEERAFKKTAKHVLTLSDAQLEKLVEARKFKEVKRNDKEEVQE